MYGFCFFFFFLKAAVSDFIFYQSWLLCTTVEEIPLVLCCRNQVTWVCTVRWWPKVGKLYPLHHSHPLGTFSILLHCWCVGIAYSFTFQWKKITFSLHSLSSYSQWIQQVVCQFLRNYTGKRWTGVDGLTFLNSCCVVDSAVLEKNRSWGNAAMSSPLLPKALANIYIWRKCGSQRDSWQRD